MSGGTPSVRLNLSTGSLLATVLIETNRAIVRAGLGTVTTAGTSGFDVVTSISAAQDTLFQNALLASPILLGVGADDITFKPLQYPELAGNAE